MNTDRELLDLAAKAAGYGEPWTLLGYDTLYIGPKYKPGNPVEYKVWNPLEDDGDAMRLAVALCMSLLIGQGGTVAAYIDNDDLSFEAIEHYLPDGNAATRRAIVRAAAEIGKEMK